jgi:hypothetical protein
MCIVIDINTFSMVFDTANAKHADFSPIKEWLERRQGLIVFGGTKYLRELQHNRSHLRIINQLRTAGLAVRIDDKTVDEREETIRQMTTELNCNDQHIIALLGVSGSSILSSLDSESYPFIKDRKLYPAGLRRVRIYSSCRNKRLLQRCSVNDVRNAV